MSNMSVQALQAVVNSLNNRSEFFEAVLSNQSVAPIILGGNGTMKSKLNVSGLTQLNSNLNLNGTLSVTGAVGFNGATPLTVQTVPGEVLGEGNVSAVANLVNSMRSVLIAYGLMQ